jgi:AMP phosphorylase
LFDVEQGKREIILNAEEALELDYNVLDRVLIIAGKKKAEAIVDHAEESIKRGEVGVYRETAAALKLREGQKVRLESAHRPASLDAIKKKLDNQILEGSEVAVIIRDLMEERLSDAELASFITGVYANGMNAEETVALTKAIYGSGGVLKPGKGAVSVHSIGGVAGDRGSMLIVPILASLGFKVPKTSTRAISSASGTADAMEVLAPVTLTLKKMGSVVKKAGGCIVWGGAVNMAAADDKLIHVRRPLRLDPTPLLLSSILAKKKAEGAQYVLLDIPIGRGTKVEGIEEARELAKQFEGLGKLLDMQVHVVITDGSEPLINGIGPCFEARAVLEALQEKDNDKLVDKACKLSGIIIGMVRGVTNEEGYRIALQQIKSGKALKKFRQIIAAQGGNPGAEPEDVIMGKHKALFKAPESGRVGHIDNHAISRVCRTLGAPADKCAGIMLKVEKGDEVRKGDALYELYSNDKSKLRHALKVAGKAGLVEVKRVIMEVI